MNSSNHPVMVGFYGHSNTGKTTLIAKLVAVLQEKGVKVAVIKMTDKSISSEPEGKDTVLFRAAGAVITSLSTQHETNFVIPRNLSTDVIIQGMIMLTEIDVIIIEGANDPAIPKIRFGEIPQRENTFLTYQGDDKAIEDRIIQMIFRKDELDEN